MNIKIITVLGVLTMLYFSSCEDVLDKHNLNSVSDNIWDTENQSIMFLNRLYETCMPTSGLGEFGDLTEEFQDDDNEEILYGIYNDVSNQMGSHGNKEMHLDNYRKIRDLNILIEGVNEGSLSDSVKGLITGQAYFLRALRYWRMVRMHGGVSFVLHVQDPFYEDLNVPRETTKRSVELIVKDLDRAIKLLPEKWRSESDCGRITKGAAAAFKGRVLLTWASPLFNRSGDQSRWQTAYKANFAADSILTFGQNPRKLNTVFENIFTDNVMVNDEAILFRTYDGTVYKNNWEENIRPMSGGGAKKCQPTWELVKAFPMANGKFTADPTSGFDSVMYWVNRDPRFYYTVGFTGGQWPMAGRTTGSDVIAYYASKNYIENLLSSLTNSFLCRKASDYGVDYAEVGNTTTTWHELRYAEVLLNLAECANEIGDGQTAIDKLIMVRKRAGIEAGDDGNYGLPDKNDQEFLRETIMNERLAEFAYEGKRYWDLRRRLMYRKDLGKYTKKLNGTQRHSIVLRPKSPYTNKVGGTGAYSKYYRIDTVLIENHFDLNSAVDYDKYFTRSYNVIEETGPGLSGIITYQELYDFYVIPKAIIESCPAVKQTIGWKSDATFDPLAE
ncbi:MAG: RagB/SusD family nutrient uptake outer membrane protein [Marinilabiliaceae bacterium]|nr:RagB/SusD family nutrient uptake outer membrane protein [Marinilabiliaceae bacterium]